MFMCSNISIRGLMESWFSAEAEQPKTKVFLTVLVAGVKEWGEWPQAGGDRWIDGLWVARLIDRDTSDKRDLARHSVLLPP